MAADQPSPALKEIFNADRLQHIATEMTAVYPALQRQSLPEIGQRRPCAIVNHAAHGPGQRVPARGTAVEL